MSPVQTAGLGVQGKHHPPHAADIDPPAKHRRLGGLVVLGQAERPLELEIGNVGCGQAGLVRRLKAGVADTATPAVPVGGLLGQVELARQQRTVGPRGGLVVAGRAKVFFRDIGRDSQPLDLGPHHPLEDHPTDFERTHDELGRQFAHDPEFGRAGHRVMTLGAVRIVQRLAVGLGHADSPGRSAQQHQTRGNENSCAVHVFLLHYFSITMRQRVPCSGSAYSSISTMA